MSKKRTIVTIIFRVEVSFPRAREIIKNLCDKCAPHLAYKKYGTIKQENIKLWRNGMSYLVGYHGKDKQCSAVCSFFDAEDASLFEDYVDDYLNKHRELHEEIIHIE